MEKPPIDWNLCILCQQAKKNEKLLNPAMNSNRRATEFGYQTLSQNLLLFNEIGNVPFNIRLSELLSDESSLYESLIKKGHVGTSHAIHYAIFKEHTFHLFAIRLVIP